MSDGPKNKNIILDLDGTLIDSICIEDSEVPETSNDAQKLAEISKMVAREWGPASALVDTGTGVEAIFKRPGVDEFLDFCFRNFRNVGIWTHSNKEWVDLVLEHAFQQHPADSFAFIFTWDSRPETDSITDGNSTSCSNSRSRQQAEHVGDGKESIEQAAAEGLPTRLTKDLRIIFESEEWRSAGFAACNTIIVEDTPSNCKLTPENALTVNSFDVVSHRGRLATADSSRNCSASSCDPWRDDVLTRVQAVLQHPDVLDAADVRSLLGVHVVASSTCGAARRGLLCAGLRPVRRQIPAQPHMLPHATSS